MKKKSLALITALAIFMSSTAYAGGLDMPRTSSGADIRNPEMTEQGAEESPGDSQPQEKGTVPDQDTGMPDMNMEMPELPTQETESSTGFDMSQFKQIAAEEPAQMTLDQFLATMDTQSETYKNLDYGDVFDIMKNSVMAGESIDLSSVLSIKGLTVPNNEMFDLSKCGLTGEIDPSLINLQYAEMVTGMDKDAQALDLSSQSKGAVSLFRSEYGNIAESIKTLDEYKIPKSFNVDTMAKKQNKEIDKIYKEAYKDTGFKNIRNTIDSSSVFEEANKGVPTATLDDQTEANNRANRQYYESTAEKSKSKTNEKLYGEDGYVTKQKKKKEEQRREAMSHLDGGVENQVDNIDEYWELFNE